MESVKTMKRSDYSYFQSITTRWADNDSYGHVNNVVYYSYFDTIANQYLIEFSDFKPLSAPIIGLVAHSNCTYIKAIAYPDLSMEETINKFNKLLPKNKDGLLKSYEV